MDDDNLVLRYQENRALMREIRKKKEQKKKVFGMVVVRRYVFR
jgi:hypothetical protein